MTNETVSKWFKVVGSTANEQCYLNIEPGRCYISDAAGEVATSAMDWDVMLDAPTLEALAELCLVDINGFEKA